MISTVTVSTVSTVATAAITGSLTLVAILTLLFLLIQKELTTTSSGRLARAFARALTIGIVPLFIGFTMIVVVRVVEALR
jgi:hypothetical protein